MDTDLLDYIREREQSCRLRAAMCPVFDQAASWLDRAAEWAALADDISQQRNRGSDIAPLRPAAMERVGAITGRSQ